MGRSTHRTYAERLARAVAQDAEDRRQLVALAAYHARRRAAREQATPTRQGQ